MPETESIYVQLLFNLFLSCATVFLLLRFAQDFISLTKFEKFVAVIIFLRRIVLLITSLYDSLKIEIAIKFVANDVLFYSSNYHFKIAFIFLQFYYCLLYIHLLVP